MRFFYLDPGLKNDVGHHANYCRYIVSELRARGVQTLVFSHLRVDPALRSELGAIPHFRVYTYDHSDGDPVCGWLTGFENFARLTCEDLCRLPAAEPSDIVYMSSAWPVQLMALAEWGGALSPDRQPTIVAESSETGLAVEDTSDGLQASVPDPRSDPRATLFRYVAKRLPRQEGARFHFITFDQIPSQLFSMLLQYPVRTLPLPYRSVIPLRSRAGARPVVVAILGHQRLEKGYDRLPKIAKELLRTRPDICLLVQHVRPDGPPETKQNLRDMAANNDRLVLEEKPAGRAGWPQLLERSDLILCPHRPQFCIASFSSVAAEALANGIPLVVPAGTPLATLLAECGGPGTTFDQFEPASITAATSEALDDFDHFAMLAHAAALQWPETRGPARMVDDLISLIAAEPSDSHFGSSGSARCEILDYL
jgi:glycosyltransferase involved in cell wall biosynthesis